MLTKIQLKKEVECFPEEFSVEFAVERIRSLEKKAMESSNIQPGNHHKSGTSIDKWFK